jgi:hypothetical protein
MLKRVLSPVTRSIEENHTELEGSIVGNTKTPIWRDTCFGIKQVAVYYRK